MPLADAIGPENDKHLAGLTPDGPVVACWGAHPFAAARAARVLEILGGVPLWCLGTTKDGWPRHPARLGNDTPLVPFTPRPAPPEIQ